MKPLLMKIFCFVLILSIVAPCLVVNGDEDKTLSKWKIENYVITQQGGLYIITKGDTLVAASERAYGRINRAFSVFLDRRFSLPWTLEAFLY